MEEETRRMRPHAVQTSFLIFVLKIAKESAPQSRSIFGGEIDPGS